MSGRRQRSGWKHLRRIWLGPLSLLGGCAALGLFAFFAWDWYFHRPEHLRALGPLELLLNYDLETLQNALGNLAQTVAAVVGIVITVVAIVVQLAANRYTPRVTELFFRERTNFIVLGFFVVTAIVAIWVSLSVGNGFLPRASVVASVVAVTASLLLMVPYFGYVFDFLDPENIVGHIEQRAFDAATRLADKDVQQAQEQLLSSVEQLADIAIAATSSRDKIISGRAIDALRVLLVRYTRAKDGLPERWFSVEGRLAENPDFQAMNLEALQDLIARRLWVEWKVLRQYQGAYNEALGRNPDMNYLIAINTRYLGEAVLAGRSRGALSLVVKFFNTYLRATLNHRQVRTAYNVMNQYRQLVEAMTVAEEGDLVQEIAGYFRYYGQVAHGMGLGFVAETIAYDLASLCELAHRSGSSATDRLLHDLLELDKEPEGEDEGQEATLRGVRKAQARLAAYYLLEGDEARARRIYRDMEHERPERLASIRDELLGVATKDFWEVIDRGANFDYMDDERKRRLEEFFEWFPRVGDSGTGRLAREAIEPTGGLEAASR